MGQAYYEKRPVHEVADELSDAITFTDQKGDVHGFRIYQWMGKKGLSDVKAENIILPAVFQDIDIDSNCGVAIVSTAINCWRIFPLEGSLLAIIPPFASEFASLQAAKDWLSAN